MTSKILITNDFEAVREKMLKEFGEKNLRFIPKIPPPEFKMDDARAVEHESYIAENSEKIIVIMAHSFRNEAQNCLLKLFEEPPTNIKFLLVAPSKNLLLPTVRSRFICENLKSKIERNSVNLDLKHLDLRQILDFLQKNEGLEKGVLMDFVADLALQSAKVKSSNLASNKTQSSVNLSENDLEFFYKAYDLARLNARSSLILATLLLNLYEKA